MAEEIIKEKKVFTNPFWIENNIIIFDLPKKILGDWSKKYGMFAYLGMELGGLWVSFGRFILKHPEIKKVIYLNPEKTLLPFLTWLPKVIFGPQIDIEFKDIKDTKDAVLVGDFEQFLDIDKLVEKLNGMSVRKLRELTEIFASSHIILADFLYQIDMGTNLGDTPYAEEIEISPKYKLPAVINKISSLQSYGRYSIRKWRKEIIERFEKRNDICLFIPCTLSKPYYKNAYGDLKNLVKEEIIKKEKDIVVMTTIGVVPYEFWEDPIDIGYDVRVPDLWSDYISMKNFFLKNQYKGVHVYTNYPPYIEMVKILHKYGIIKKIIWGIDDKAVTRKGNFGAFFAIPQSNSKFNAELKKSENSEENQKCYFCQKIDEEGEMIFDWEFDTFIHKECLIKAIKDEDEDAIRMSYLLTPEELEK